MDEVDILGIDLGTTNSVIAVWEPQMSQSKVLSNREGQRLTPSVVAFDPESGEPLVGLDAIKRLAERPHEVAYSVKRFIGLTRQNKGVREDWQQVTYPLEETPSHKILVRLGEHSLTPSEVSAEVLGKMKRDGE